MFFLKVNLRFLAGIGWKTRGFWWSSQWLRRLGCHGNGRNRISRLAADRNQSRPMWWQIAVREKICEMFRMTRKHRDLGETWWNTCVTWCHMRTFGLRKTYWLTFHKFFGHHPIIANLSRCPWHEAIFWDVFCMVVGLASKAGWHQLHVALSRPQRCESVAPCASPLAAST